MLACLFAVGGPAAARAAARLEALAGYYAPLGATPERSACHAAGAGVAVGWVAFTEAEAARLERSWRETGLAWWGEPPPAALADGARLAAAGDGALRGLPPFAALFARGPEGVRVAGGPGPPTALYAAGGALATHAVACAWLADGRAELDPRRLPELAALGFVGGTDTLLRGVRAVAPATVAEVGAHGARRRSYWPARERWAAVPDEEPGAAAEAALLASLAARVPDGAALGLTAGLDSLVVAAAMERIGRPARAFTWGLDPADVAGGPEAAARLGLAHEALPLVEAAPGTALERARAEARWTEGMGLTSGFGAVPAPRGAPALLTGAGGETARAFYWRWQAANHAEPSQRQLERAFRPDARIAAAHEAARAAVRGRAAAWIAEAAGHGARGWRVLDVLYAEQRMTRWGRGTLPRLAAVPVHAFTHPAVAAALVSLPARARVSDGFHRAFLRRHAGGLPLPPAPPRQQAGVPRPVRRLRAALRAAPPPAPWPLAHLWAAQPEYREWIEEAVLGGAIVREALGAGWAAATRAGLRARESGATDTAITVSGAVALEESLAGLRGS